MPSNSFILFTPVSSCPQFFPASGSFPMSQFFIPGGQNIGASVSASVLPMNIQDWLPLGMTSLISLQSKRLSESYPTLQYKSINSSRSAFLIVQLSHPYMTTGKTIPLTRRTFVGKVTSLLFNMLSRLAISFLPRSMRLNFMAAVTICSDFGAPQIKFCHCFQCFPLYLPWSDGTGCHDLRFLNTEF